MKRAHAIRGASLLLAAGVMTISTAAPSTAAPTPAVSYPAKASCSTTGATGYSSTGAGAPDDTHEVLLYVEDTKADGHHVQVRYLTKDGSTSTKKWPWHSVIAGKGHGGFWHTTASETYGIYAYGVEVARFEGSQYMNSCIDWA